MRLYPFPNGTKLLESPKDYFALVASEFMGESHLIGLAFIKEERRLIKTVLGGMLAHSDTPNCMLITHTKDWILWAIKDIYPNEELTINYNVYGIT